MITAVCVLAAAIVGPAVAPAEATHARYANYNWHPTGVANQIDFVLQNAFRRNANPCVSVVTMLLVPCTAGDGFPAVGDLIVEFTGATSFSPDGITFLGSPFGPLVYLVTSIDPANNWLVGTALDPSSFPAVDTNVTYTYAGPGNYIGFTDSCCRISALASPNDHMNNPDGGFRFETLVNVGTLGTNRSPVSSVPVIVLCPINALCLFPISSVDPDGDTLHFRMSTAAEASSSGPGFNSLGTICVSTFCQPGPPFATFAASVNGATGLYSWDTTGAQLSPGVGLNTLYSTQVTIEDLDALGNVKSKIPVDFLIQLVPLVGSPPQFVSPTPQCGTTLNANVGTLLTFTVQASDPDGADVVTLNVVGLPPGATMTPGLPTSGNPVSSVFSWTPAAAGTFVLTFTAADQTGQQATCAFAIDVAAGPPPSAEGRMTGGGGRTTAGGIRVRHGFTLDCDLSGNHRNLEVNFGRVAFHLEAQTTALCTDDPNISGGNPAAPFDTYEGSGTGRTNTGISGATATWKFTDAGEPGKNDYFEILIMDGPTVLISVSGTLERGNHQAHPTEP